MAGQHEGFHLFSRRSRAKAGAVSPPAPGVLLFLDDEGDIMVFARSAARKGRSMLSTYFTRNRLVGAVGQTEETFFFCC
jgi:hypothetical protein